MRINSKLVVLISVMLLTLTCSQVFALNEILDQKQEITDGRYQIQAGEPMGQAFIPTLTPLTSVEVHIETANPGSDDTITCRIRYSTIDGTILGTASQFVTSGFNGWLRFTFDPPIIVTPGSTYFIELDANAATFSWNIQFTGNQYPDGIFIASGFERVDEDAMFRTYSFLSSTVGGISTPINKLEILTPYLALAGLIIAVSVIVIKKRN
ncbi:hypothetical protein ACFLQ6_05560 [Thermoproteota archaeon]